MKFITKVNSGIQNCCSMIDSQYTSNQSFVMSDLVSYMSLLCIQNFNIQFRGTQTSCTLSGSTCSNVVVRALQVWSCHARSWLANSFGLAHSRIRGGTGWKGSKACSQTSVVCFGDWGPKTEGRGVVMFYWTTLQPWGLCRSTNDYATSKDKN